MGKLIMHRLRKPIILLWVIGLLPMKLSASTLSYEEALVWASGSQQTMENVLRELHPDTNPAFITEDPEEVTLADQDLEQLGQQQWQTNPQATALRERFTQAPRVSFANDELMKLQTQSDQQLQDETLFCVEGDCTPIDDPEFDEDDFIQALSSLSSIEAGSATLNPNNTQIFPGTVRKCRRKAVGFSDCCVDKGWGQEVGLAHCNSKEKQLGQDKQKHLCASVGEYCAKRVLGTCVTRKKSYCCFANQLSAIVQLQGRGQLGLSYGQAKQPQCRGLTLSEIQRIDFEQLNFSNFVDELHQQMSIPDSAALRTELRQRIENFYQQQS